MSDASLADGFRDTEIGSLPVDWQVGRLGHVEKCVCGAASLCLLTLSRGGRADDGQMQKEEGHRGLWVSRGQEGRTAWSATRR